MDRATFKERINTVNEAIKESSFKAKTNLKSEGIIHQLIDDINALKNDLIQQTEKLTSIIKDLESLTWMDEPMDEDGLRKLNELIASSRDLHSAFIKNYERYLTPLTSKGIFAIELKNYKQTLDTLKEVYSDIESVFFFLPNDSEFIALTNRLHSLK